jgi:hypothetical protein
MKARHALFIAITVVAFGGTYLLSFVGEARDLPADAIHAAHRSRAQCLGCHLPQRLTALEEAGKHPWHWRNDRLDCVACHRAKPPDGQTRSLQSVRAEKPMRTRP